MATTIFEPFDEVVETQTRNVFQTLNDKDRRRFAATRQGSSAMVESPIFQVSSLFPNQQSVAGSKS